ncbi:MAG TPA: NADH:flavin oxidoreductase [Planctomycetota bacterium]|nr:NADH:flavin oxidoreductase [Planctomycetota bacterium]
MRRDFLKGNPLFADRETLLAEIARLGVDITLEPDVRETLRPARIGPRTVGNRFVIHPMEGCDGTLDGKPDEVTYHRWGRFARGGAKILWGEACAVVPEGRANARQLLFSRSNAAALARLIAFAREEHRKACGADGDFLVGLQLTHSGRFSYPTPSLLVRDPVIDPFARIGKERRPLPDDFPVLSDADLDRLQDAYVEAARWAREAGCDFVDVKQCHRYLLSEMLGARTRPGKYGGSLENRTRFAREVFARIRSEVGPDLLLATRMNVFDAIPFRRNPETGIGEPVPAPRPYPNAFGSNPDNPLEPDLREPLEAIRTLREAGLAILNVSAGCPYYNPHFGRPADTPPPDGYEMPEPGLVGVERHFRLTEAIQRAFPDLAVVGTGYSYLRQFAAEAGESNVRRGRVTFVGLGRGAIAYPDWVRDLQEKGRMERLKSCITVSYCTTLMRAKGNALGQYPAGCVPRDPLYAKFLQDIRKAERTRS